MPDPIELAAIEIPVDIEEQLEVEEDDRDLPIFENLDAGNIVDQLQNNEETYEDLSKLYEEAQESMEKWSKKYKNALMLAKLQPSQGGKEIEKKTFPFEGASLAMMPYILEAMLDFSSRVAPELVWSTKIVGTRIYGKENDQKNERADRIDTYMNYQLSEEIPYWREGQDKGLFALPCTGTFYKETYYDYEEKAKCSDLVMADEVVFNHDHPYFEMAPDKFREMKYSKNSVIGFIRGEQEWDIEESDLPEDEEELTFIRAFSWHDLDEDGLQEPYEFVMYPETGKIVCMYPAYDKNTVFTNDDDEIVKIKDVPCFTQYQFLPDPEGGPMGMGWGILMGPMFSAVNTTIRQLIDAGTLANTASNSGIIATAAGGGRGGRQQSGPIDVKLGQLTPVPMDGMNGSLQQNVVQFPFAGPNAALFEVTRYLVESARQMTSVATQIEANPNEAVGMYLARLQQGLKSPNLIAMRVHEAQRKEMQKIALLNYEHHDSEQYNRVLDEDKEWTMKADFNPKDCDIQLISNPALGSDIERAARAQAVRQMAMEGASMGSPTINLREADLGVLKAMNVPDIDRLAPEPEPDQISPADRMKAAQEAAEMEMKKTDQALRQQGQRIQEMKMAHEAAKTMAELGLKNDIQEAEIAKKYMETLKIAADMGLALDLGQGIETIKQIESTFIEGNSDGTRAGLPTGNPDGV